MRPAVRAAWHRFSEPLEGRVRHMYGDLFGYVTTAVGVLLPTVASAVALPWLRHNGSLATAEEIAESYALVRSAPPAWRDLGGGHAHWLSLTTLRLSEVAIDALVETKLDQTERHLKGRLADWDTWPADAQLALLSWAWGVGPAAVYPRMFAALARRDFLAASREVDMNPKVGTIVDRNRANVLCLRNAAKAEAHGFDPGVLFWPKSVEDAIDTLTEIPSPPTVPPSRLGEVLRMTATRKAVEDGLATRDDDNDDGGPDAA